MMEDYVIYMLTGNAVINYSLAARSMAFDITKLLWSDEIFDAAGIDKRLFSAPVISGTSAGRVRPEHKLVLQREIVCSLEENKITVKDKIVNRGDAECPAMILYHMNMGYPLLSESARLCIPSCRVLSRNEQAKLGIDTWQQMLPSQPRFEEQCYFHQFEKKGRAGIYNPDIGQGLLISFDADRLNYFTEWKMMGERDYVLGLEPGNCHPDGRDRMREEGTLTILQPGESAAYEVDIRMIADEEMWEAILGGKQE